MGLEGLPPLSLCWAFPQWSLQAQAGHKCASELTWWTPLSPLWQLPEMPAHSTCRTPPEALSAAGNWPQVTLQPFLKTLKSPQATGRQWLTLMCTVLMRIMGSVCCGCKGQIHTEYWALWQKRDGKATLSRGELLDPCLDRLLLLFWAHYIEDGAHLLCTGLL